MALGKQASKQTQTGNAPSNLSKRIPTDQHTDPAPKSSLKSSKKAAWLEAPLPQFYDSELAGEMVKEGYYATLEDAYIEVPKGVLKRVRQTVEAYLLDSHPVSFWTSTPLPSPKK